MLARVLRFAKQPYSACMWLHFTVVGHSYTFCCFLVVLHHLSCCAVHLNQSFMCNAFSLLLAMTKPCGCGGLVLACFSLRLSAVCTDCAVVMRMQRPSKA